MEIFHVPDIEINLNKFFNKSGLRLRQDRRIRNGNGRAALLLL